MTVSTVGLVRSWMSGDSCFAALLTSSKSNVRELPAPIVPVTAPSKAYGTSTPAVLRPSARTYSTCTRLIVTSLFVVGERGAVAPGSLSGARSVTLPLSSKTVGQGVALVHGSGVVTFVTTSDVRKPD